MSDLKSAYVIGAGGHAKVVISTLQAMGFKVEAVFDDDESKIDTTLLGVPIRDRVAKIMEATPLPTVNAIGSNVARRKLSNQLDGINWLTIVHPSAFVHPSVQIGCGTVVFAGAVIQPDTIIGAHSIVNTGTTIDHDCQTGDFVHIAPGVHLAGEVKVGEGTFLGIGSSVIPQVKIGSWCVVGAGSVVIKDVPDNVVVVGVPARILRKIEDNK